jgi:signal transduction histidine kinase
VRPRPTILVKLLVAFAAPTLALFGLFAYVAYDVARRDLDAELGTRMTTIAASAAAQLSGGYLVRLAPGNEDDVRRQQQQGRLAELAAATGARLYVLDRDFASRLDTDEAVAIGTRYHTAELDRVEIGRVFAEATPAASVVTFEGETGRRYKAGYAPLVHDGEVVLAVGAQAPAGYFARLDDLRDDLVLWGAGLAAVVLGASLGIAILISRPVRALERAARRIGRGDLEAPVAVRAGDELGLLAETMERMRRQLRERDARMQQMLAGIAHEVRNPLAGMTLFSGILRDELAGDERASHVERIARELGYLERVVGDFLEYARRPAPDLAEVDLAALFAEVAQLVAGEAERAGVAVVVEADAAGAVRADPGQLRRALLNLARNAVQAATAGAGPVRLRARRQGAAVHLEVTNHGPAIPAELRDRVFEPFFTTREKGTGLGLAFVREIVHGHGGRVDVACEAGETRFRVTLPAG